MKIKSNARLSLRKLLLSALVAAPLATLPVPLWALPANQTALNGIITPSSGVSVVLTNANRIDVTSSATNSFVKWTDFGGGANTIANGDLINYTLPSTSASMLNMVTGTNATTISGKLTANGNLYVLNPNGITVGATGIITANAVGLSTIPETEYYFLNTGSLSFQTNNAASVTQPITTISGATITAASGTGNIWLAGNGASLAGNIDGGSLTVTSLSGGAVVLAAGGALTVGDAINKVGNVTVTNDTGTITIGSGSANTVIYGPSVSLTAGNAVISSAGTGTIVIGSGSAGATLTTNSGTKKTDFASASSVSASGSNTLTVNSTTSSATGDVSVNSASDLAFGGTVGNNLVLTSTGNVTLNNATVTGTVALTAGGSIKSGGTLVNTVGNNIGLIANSAKDITLVVQNDLTSYSLTGAGTGNISLTSTTGVASIGGLSAANVSVTAGKDITQSVTGSSATGSLTFNSTGGNVTLSLANSADKLSVTANQGISVSAAQTGTTSATFNAGTTLGLGGTVGTATLTTKSGTDTTITAAQSPSTLGNITAGGILAVNAALTAPTLKAKADTMTQTAAIASSGTATLDGNTSITLTNVANDFTTLVIKNAPSGATVDEKNGLTLGTGTAATGNVTIVASKGAAGDVILGAASGDTLTFGKILTINNTGTVNANITDLSDNVAVTGNVTLSVAGTGVVTLDGSAGNAIGLNSTYGQMNITSANTDAKVFAAGNLNLGTINLGTGSLTAYGTSGITNSGVLTLNNATVGAGTTAAPGDIALNNYNSTGPVVNQISGTVKILTDFQLVGSAQVGNYLVKNLTVSNGAASADLVDIPANIYSAGIAGNVSIRTYGATNLAVGPLTTTGPVWLQSDTGSITATNAANTFKIVTVTTNNTTGASAVSAKGDLTVNGNVSGTSNQTLSFTSGGNLTIGSYSSLNSASTIFDTVASHGWIADSNPGIFIYGDVTFQGGSVNVVQAGHNFGKLTIDTHANNGAATIVEGGTSNYKSINTGSGAFSGTSQNGDVIEAGGTGSLTSTGAVSLSAVNGAVTLDGTTNAFGNISLTAKNSSLVKNTAATILGTSSVTAGNLTVANSTTGTDITQKSGSKLYTYGATSFTAVGAGNITINQSGNQMGAVTATTGTGAVTLKESTTLNLAGITTSGGKVVATSENGDIIDSGASTVGSSAVTFNAPNGNINLTKSSTFASTGTTGVSFNTAGNVSVKSAGSIQFDTSTVTGTFTASATGNMTQLGAFNVGGDVSFTPTGSITFNNTSNQFGAFKFTAGGASIIDEATTFNLKAGSFATAAVTINTGSDFLTSGTGGSSFTGSGLTINATSGTIRPSSGSLLVTGQLTVSSNVAIDLGQLSLSGNLNNVPPVHTGTGTYTAPSP